MGAVQLALLVGPLVTALTGVVLYRTARRLAFGAGAAALAVLAWGLGTLAWPYSRTLFTEPTAALGLSLALYGAVTFRRASGRAATRALVLAGCGLALLTLAKQANAVVVLPFAAYLVYVAFAERRAELTWQRLARMGSWPSASRSLSPRRPSWPTIAAHLARCSRRRSTIGKGSRRRSSRACAGCCSARARACCGTCRSPGLAIASAFFWRRGKRLPDFLLALGAVLSLLLLYSAWSDWAGGRSWGPRSWRRSCRPWR